MKENWKKLVILAILAAVLVYVWLPQPSQVVLETEYLPKADVTDSTSRPKKLHQPDKVPVLYRAPKVNPFERVSSQRSPVRTEKNMMRAAVEQQRVSAKILGITLAKNRPQAILQMENGSSLVVGIADSIGCWKIVTIQNSFLVLQCGRQRDTIRQTTL